MNASFHPVLQKQETVKYGIAHIKWVSRDTTYKPIQLRMKLVL